MLRPQVKDPDPLPETSMEANTSLPETKLLRSGKKYPLGRKDRELLVNNKKISRDHCEFTVGPYTEEDMVHRHSSAALSMH